MNGADDMAQTKGKAIKERSAKLEKKEKKKREKQLHAQKELAKEVEEAAGQEAPEPTVLPKPTASTTDASDSGAESKPKKAAKRKMKVSFSAAPDQVKEVPESAADVDAMEPEKKKRKRKKQRGKSAQPAPAPKDPVEEQRAIQEYLVQWQSDKAAWRFNKNKQMWLLSHLYSSEQVTDDMFTVALEYLEDLKGAARTRAFQEAKGFVETEEEMPEWKMDRAAKLMRALG